MRRFRDALERAAGEPRPSPSAWAFVAYDQLSDGIGLLARSPPEETGIVLVECPAKAARRPYHKQKLYVVLANQRRFALEQAARGVHVRYVVARDRDGYAATLERVARELGGPLIALEPAERELHVELRGLVGGGVLELQPHDGWCTTDDDFVRGTGAAPPWRMDRFYRHVRRRTGVLMTDGGEFEGGRLSFDHDNRETWSGAPPAPAVPTFRPGEIEDEVCALIEARFARHPGAVDATALPTRARQIARLWKWARDECMPYFGPYEDAMSSAEASLFHTRISPLLNLHRLLPWDVVRDVSTMDAPIACREGFVRQVLGWREFVRHVHRRTDGFRELPDDTPAETNPERDAGWSRWTGDSWSGSTDGGASPSFLGSERPLPPAYWGRSSGLACLDVCAGRVMRSGYGHHIERLMVLSNLASLLDVSPRQLTDWFWAAYVDAYDWVVEPNVLGMGTFAAGPVMTTKPYVSGAAYIDRMSDFCGDCRFHPKRNCPITRLYWAYLARHADTLAGNQRLRMPLRSLEKRGATRRAADARVFEVVSTRLSAGDEVSVGDVDDALRTGS